MELMFVECGTHLNEKEQEGFCIVHCMAAHPLYRRIGLARVSLK